MSKIATEYEAYNIGQYGTPDYMKGCTKARALELGVNNRGELKNVYESDQLVPLDILQASGKAPRLSLVFYWNDYFWDSLAGDSSGTPLTYDLGLGNYGDAQFVIDPQGDNSTGIYIPKTTVDYARIKDSIENERRLHLTTSQYGVYYNGRKLSSITYSSNMGNWFRVEVNNTEVKPTTGDYIYNMLDSNGRLDLHYALQQSWFSDDESDTVIEISFIGVPNYS